MVCFWTTEGKAQVLATQEKLVVLINCCCIASVFLSLYMENFKITIVRCLSDERERHFFIIKLEKSTKIQLQLHQDMLDVPPALEYENVWHFSEDPFQTHIF